MTTDTMTTGSTGVGVETIVSALENGVVGIPPEAAMGAIIQWESTLASSGDADLQTIATDLATLRGALTADSLDGVTIGEILLSLGNRIQNVSGSLEGGAMQSLLNLGDILNREGANLADGTATMSDTGAGRSGRDLNGEMNGPEVSSGSLTTGASFTGGSTTMQNQFDNDTDNAATGKSGGGI